MEEKLVQLSKFLSLILRHRPDKIGLELDAQGWVAIDRLLSAAASHGRKIRREDLDRVVAENEKKRFAISEDGLRIRASQGHSTEVDLGYAPQTPPEFLYHGTATRFLESIRLQGLIKGNRHHVHLSLDKETAVAVGKRHGKPIVLVISCAEMVQRGFEFFVSANGVWLTDHVPPEYITEETTSLE
ncbi:MAG: RNA 2'-phosphotransferase [Pirellulales bacterium]